MSPQMERAAQIPLPSSVEMPNHRTASPEQIASEIVNPKYAETYLEARNRVTLASGESAVCGSTTLSFYEE